MLRSIAMATLSIVLLIVVLLVVLFVEQQLRFVMLLKHVLVHRLHVLLIANVLRQLCVVLLWVFVMLLKDRKSVV